MHRRLHKRILRLKQALISENAEAVLTACYAIEYDPCLWTQERADELIGELAVLIQQPEINESKEFGRLMLSFEMCMWETNAGARNTYARSIFTIFGSLKSFPAQIGIAECVAQSLPIDDLVVLFSSVLDGATEYQKYALLDGVMARVFRGSYASRDGGSSDGGSSDGDEIGRFKPLVTRVASGATDPDVKFRAETALQEIESRLSSL